MKAPAADSADAVERFLETPRMGFFGLGQSLEPVGDFGEAFLARGLGHARIHVGVFVSLAGDRGFEIVRGRTDRLAGRRVADFLEEFEMAVRVAGLAFGGGAEDRRDVVEAFDVGLLREIEIAAIRLAFAGERVLQILFGLGAFQGHRILLWKNEIERRASNGASPVLYEPWDRYCQ